MVVNSLSKEEIQKRVKEIRKRIVEKKWKLWVLHWENEIIGWYKWNIAKRGLPTNE